MGKSYIQTGLIALFCFLAACKGTSTDKSQATVPTISSLGSTIAYSDTQKGDTTLLFIHGWGINRGVLGKPG